MVLAQWRHAAQWRHGVTCSSVETWCYMQLSGDMVLHAAQWRHGVTCSSVETCCYMQLSGDMVLAQWRHGVSLVLAQWLHAAQWRHGVTCSSVETWCYMQLSGDMVLHAAQWRHGVCIQYLREVGVPFDGISGSLDSMTHHDLYTYAITTCEHHPFFLCIATSPPHSCDVHSYITSTLM